LALAALVLHHPLVTAVMEQIRPSLVAEQALQQQAVAAVAVTTPVLRMRNLGVQAVQAVVLLTRTHQVHTVLVHQGKVIVEVRLLVPQIATEAVAVAGQVLLVQTAQARVTAVRALLG
jgi:hypothetical protein